MAYLTHLLQNDMPLFALARTGLGYALLDRRGAAQIADRLRGNTPWGRIDAIGRLSFKASPAKRRAEADLRRLSIGRCLRGRLAQMVAQKLPRDIAYLNVGHSNLTDEVLAAWQAVDAKISVLIHDTIPLDHPKYQRPGTPAQFEDKLRRVATFADLVICNSHQTQDDVQRWFGQWGYQVNTLVAHLGVDLPKAEIGTLPEGMDPTHPYFVTLGTIEPRKNHAVLLDVWEALAKEIPPGDLPHLYIVGARGWENEDVFQRLDHSPLMGKSVFEMSNLPDNAVAALMSQANAVLFPSHAEGYGLPPAEAISLGTPVICSDLAVFREVLGNIPVYLKPDDVYSWKQSIIGSTQRKRAGQRKTSEEPSDFNLPTWADHFNLVLRET
jgi:glycosyltransferase involved in cell wall biosynthesis